MGNILAIAALAGAILLAYLNWDVFTPHESTQVCFPTETLSVETSLNGEAVIEGVINESTYWLLLANNTDISKFASIADTPCKGQKILPARNSVQIKLSGIQVGDDMYRITGAKKPPMDAKEYLDLLLEEKPVSYRCHGHDKHGFPVCNLSVEGLDLGMHLMLRGYGYYQANYDRHPWMHDIYVKTAEVVASGGQ